MFRIGMAADRRFGGWLVGLAAVGVGLSMLPSTAGASGSTPTLAVSCPRFDSHVVSGKLGALQTDSQTGQPDGFKTVTGDPKQVTPYVAQTKVGLRYGGNSYVVRRGTLFSLGCYGQSVAHPHVLYAKLFVEHGAATVHTVASTPGALQTWEALVNPVGHVAQRITLKEAGTPTNTFMTMSSSGPIVDITPERGANAGHCIYHHAIRAHSAWDQHAQNFRLSVTVVS
jgi:hypothetical protein